MTTRPPSYSPTSLISLRAHASSSQETSPAEALNLWKPTALHDTNGQSQPFPFEDYPRGIIGTIKTSAHQINQIFDDSDMSDWDIPADNDGAWAATVEPPVTMKPDMATPDDVDSANVHADGHDNIDAPLVITEVRKSSLADLTNGNREAINVHLAQGLGPHKLLPRFSSDKAPSESADAAAASPVNDAVSLTEPDGAASVVDDSTSNNGASSPPSATRKPAPHRKLQALAQEIPLPQSPAPLATSSTSGEGPSTPVAPSIPEPAIIVDNESDSDSAFVKVEPISEPKLDPKADAWVPDITVEFLPPSCPVSPKHVSASSEALILSHCSEAECINECAPVPENWSVPAIIGAFADVDLYDGAVTGGVHQKVLCHYSQYFASALEAENSETNAELDQIVKDSSWAVFRQWVYGRQLRKNLDLKTLVQLWRFGARMQAPLFANVVADTIVAKTVTVDDVFVAADEIDGLLMMVSSTSSFRHAISQMLTLNGIQPEYQHYEKWPKSLIWSVFAWDKSAYVGSQQYHKDHPCAYHLHALGHDCKS